MNKVLTALALALVASSGSSGAHAKDVNVGVTVQGDDVDVDVFVNRKPGPEHVVPPNHARDVTAGCFYRVKNTLPDEYASWSGRCDENGYITGKGRLTFFYPSGAPDNYIQYVEGSYREGVMDGFNRTLFVSGTTHSGSYRNGVAAGDIHIEFADGSWYRGGMNAAGRYDGQGELKYANGRHYVGGFRNGDYHGKGKSVNNWGQRYSGEFRLSKPNGKGLLVTSHGECFEGDFVSGAWVGGRKWKCGS